MEDLLNKTVPQADLENFERKYHKELDEGNVTHKTQFEYSWCLVRSSNTANIRKGILLLEDLATRHTDGKRDYIYYLAIGNARIKQYSVARNYCKAFLQIEPNNQQVLSLEAYANKKDTLQSVAVAGGAALVIGGIVGLGMALANNRTKSSDKK